MQTPRASQLGSAPRAATFGREVTMGPRSSAPAPAPHALPLAATILVIGVTAAGVWGLQADEEAVTAAPGDSRLGSVGGFKPFVGLQKPRPYFFPEDACNREGGLCLHVDECPPGKLAYTAGLCPQQRSHGAECCHGISILERQCAKRTGVCRPSDQCARDLRDEHATDCPSGQSCCVLVAL